MGTGRGQAPGWRDEGGHCASRTDGDAWPSPWRLTSWWWTEMPLKHRAGVVMKWVLTKALGTLVALFLRSHIAPTVRRRDMETPRTVISVQH